jgi:hypothetical protein
MALPPRLPGESMRDYRKRVETDPTSWGRQAEAAQDALGKLLSVHGTLVKPQQPPDHQPGVIPMFQNAGRHAGITTTRIRYAVVALVLLLMVGLLLWQVGSR